MGDWFRSLLVLSLAFAGVVVITIGLSSVIVSGFGTSDPATDASGDGGSVVAGGQDATEGGAPTGVGGTLSVTGDRDGSFTLTREDTEGRYGLVGDKGRIFFEGDPLMVVQLSFDGWSFFPEPDACSITPGEHNVTIGVAATQLYCADLADVRGNGVVDVEGRIGIAADMLGMRGGLPESGGSLDVGGEAWQFNEALLFAWPVPAVAGPESWNMVLTDETSDAALGFNYDHQTHQLTLASVRRDGSLSEVASGACAFGSEVLGKLNPRVAVVQLSVQCPAVDVPGIGPAAMSGTIIVEQYDEPPIQR